MANQKPRKGYDRAGAPSARPAAGKGVPARGRAAAAASSRRQNRLVAGIVGVVAVVAIALAGVILLGQGGSGAGGTSAGTIVQSSNGSWTNISADRLASEMGTKDFTLLNVKTPYIGEISGTDLYIPYDQLAARASELPSNKSAKIVVYCRSGNESAIASQTLLDLGYTNIENLDGGMNAWTATGRTLIQKNRT